MATIEERAYRYAKMLMSNGETEDSAASAYAGYLRGAELQKQIDAEWLNNNAGKYVTMVDGQMHFDWHKMVMDFKKGIKQVEPISLTEEILVKIGFIKVNSQRYDYGNPDTDCYIKVNPKKGMIHVNGRKANCNLYNHFFVHELQHALRLCGLNELADNFKV